MMAHPIISSPFGGRLNRTDLVMLQVTLAFIPGILAMIWYFGWGVLINVLLASLFGLSCEALVMWLRGRPALPALRDYSALVTAFAFGIAVPPTLPWWLTLLGMAFAIILVKQLYGGLGYNPFNPAMAGYVFLLVSYPLAMTTWLPPDIPEILTAHHLTTLSFLDSARLIFTGDLPAHLRWDMVTAATPLDEMFSRLDQNATIPEILTSPLWGDFGGRGWEWIGNWFLLGGLFLLWRGVITWHIPTGVLTGLLIPAGLFWLVDPHAYPFPAFHLFAGGTILCAFFIATDPVTAATTPRGKLIYGMGIGLIILAIRHWGGYPDAVAFAVLLMNIAAPMIDHYTQPRVFGHDRREAS